MKRLANLYKVARARLLDHRHSDACEPWGYVAPVVAAVVTRATGVRHIYLIVTPDQISIGHDLENSFEPSYFLLLSFMHDH